MKIKELYEKDNKTLEKLLTDTKAKMVKDRFKIASKEMTKHTEIGVAKKLIARINTILRQREIVEAEKKNISEEKKPKEIKNTKAKTVGRNK